MQAKESSEAAPGVPQRAFRSAAWKLKLSAVLLSSTIFLVLLWWLGAHISIGDESLNRILHLKAYHTKIRWFGKPNIGIYEEDPVKGWQHKPSSSGRHSVPYSFDVRYHIDEQGNHLTQADPKLPKILFIGCSYTFGHGVADDSNFVAILQSRLPGYKLLNAAVNGYGSGQAYLTLLQRLEQREDLRLVVYPFLNQHAERNYLRKSWLDNLNKGRQNVLFDIENGKLAYKGLSDRVKDAISDTLLLNRKEAEISHALVQAMADTCEAKGIPFLLVHLPDWLSGSLDSQIKPIVGEGQYLDLQATIDIDTIKLPVDGHPDAKGHRLMAAQLLPFLQKNLTK